MAGWLKKHLKLQEFMGLMKDQVSFARAMAEPGQFSEVNVAVLRATGHEEHIVEKTIESVLEVGDRSRMCVSHCVCFLMDRLNKTHSWIVALKCLLVIHNCLHEGGFMYQDQLCIHPSRGGRNHLNLSKFRDTSSPFTWATSAWVRWYARYIEKWIQTSKSLGIFLAFNKTDNFLNTEKLMCLPNWQLVKQIINLEEFLHEAAGWEAEDNVLNHVLVIKALEFINITTKKAYYGMKLRFQEITERISTVAQTELLALLDVCERSAEDLPSLMRLFKNMESICNDGASGQMVYKNYEIEKLRQTLQGASLQYQSKSTKKHVMHGLQMCRSDRWENITSSEYRMKDSERRNSLSGSDFDWSLS